MNCNIQCANNTQKKEIILLCDKKHSECNMYFKFKCYNIRKFSKSIAKLPCTI